MHCGATALFAWPTSSDCQLIIGDRRVVLIAFPPRDEREKGRQAGTVH